MSNANISTATAKDLKALKKDDLIRLIINTRDSQILKPNKSPLSSIDVPNVSVSSQSPQLSFRCPHDESALITQIKSAVSEAIHSLRCELRLEYEARICELENKFHKEIESLRESFDQLKKETKSSLKDTEIEVLRDLHEGELRKNNIMIFGMRESDSASASEQKEQDRRNVEMLSGELGVDDLHFESLIRLGKPSDKPRPIKLTGIPMNQRSDLLRRAHHIPKLDEHFNFKRVFIKPDLTPKEQLVDRQLRQELRRRREAGDNVFIRDGQIVTRSFTFAPHHA